ncbi:MAG TPA: class I SAM-dependent methyltransferase [Chthoniobacterales bacterium]|jgi:2-polyprenyl-3-methyl-5-hydroxy-6-metoxy-1,4-benzoquinol methylase
MKEIIERISSRYTGRFQREYVKGKLRSDPAYQAAWEQLQDSSLPLLDVGCGIGLLSFYLRERGYLCPVLGVDFDAKKIASAQAVAAPHYADLQFRAEDVIAQNDFSGDVVIIDVLHYLAQEKQQALLHHVAGQVAPGGKCLIRTVLRDESWRFWVTALEEKFLRASRWMKSGAVHYPALEEIRSAFPEVKFKCEVRPLWGNTPFNSYFFVFQSIG